MDPPLHTWNKSSTVGAGKVMASAFWDAHDISFIDYFEKSKTINSDYYKALMVRLSAEIKKQTNKILGPFISGSSSESPK